MRVFLPLLAGVVFATSASSVAAATPDAPPSAAVAFEIVKQRGDGPELSGAVVARPWSGEGIERSVPIKPGPLTFSGETGSRWRVELAAPGWWMAPLDVTLSPSGGPIPMRVWPAATVAGKLSGAAPGKLPASLRLVVEAPPWARAERIARGTELPCSVDVSGAWRCSVPAETLDVAIIAAGYVPEYRWNVRPAPGRVTDLGAVRLREGGSVALWLSPESNDASRKAGAWATVRRQVPPEPSAVTQRLAQPVAEAAVAANGFAQLAPIPAGSYVLEAGAKGFATTRIFPVEVLDGRETVLRRPVELAPPIRVVIRVEPPVDPDGAPWTAIVRRTSSFGSAYDREAAFNGPVPASGELVIPGQSPGTFRVTIADTAGNRIADEELAAQHDSDPPTIISITVVPVRGTIRKGKSPLAATLIFGGQQGLPRVRIESNERGEFAGWVPREGPWVVDVRGSDDAVSTLKTEVQAGRDLELAVAQTRVAGMVLHGEGPAENAQVILSDARGLLLRTRTDAAGAFALTGIPPRTYTLVASARTGERSAPHAVDLPTDTAEVEGVRLELQSPGSVTGMVTGDGRPIALAHVHVFAGGAGVGGVTDADGRFRLSVPPHASRGVFVVRAPGRVLTVFERSFDAETTFEIAASGGTVQFEVPARIDGLLLLQNGTRVPLPLVLAWAQSQGVAVRQNSVVTVPNVAVGEYRLCDGTDPAKERCAHGRLMPGATLRLKVPE